MDIQNVNIITQHRPWAQPDATPMAGPEGGLLPEIAAGVPNVRALVTRGVVLALAVPGGVA